MCSTVFHFISCVPWFVALTFLERRAGRTCSAAAASGSLAAMAGSTTLATFAWTTSLPVRRVKS